MHLCPIIKETSETSASTLQVSALAPALLFNGAQLLMTYKEKLQPWCIIRNLPDMRSTFIARFRSRSDAQGHMQLLRANNPTTSYQVIFNVTPKKAEEE